MELEEFKEKVAKVIAGKDLGQGRPFREDGAPVCALGWLAALEGIGINDIRYEQDFGQSHAKLCQLLDINPEWGRAVFMANDLDDMEGAEKRIIDELKRLKE